MSLAVFLITFSHDNEMEGGVRVDRWGEEGCFICARLMQQLCGKKHPSLKKSEFDLKWYNTKLSKHAFLPGEFMGEKGLL